MSDYIQYVGLSSIPLVVGGASALLGNSRDPATKKWYDEISKDVKLRPPDAVFGPVWTILYTLMGISLATLVASTRSQSVAGSGAGGSGSLTKNPLFATAIGFFVVQLALNFMWSIVFFRNRNPKAALGILLALDAIAAAMTALFWKINRLSGMLLLPYTAWLSFATYLNASIVSKMKTTSP